MGVDDAIWEEIPMENEDVEPPQWLCDEDVREGIRAILQWDRCAEEERRLKVERGRIQEWLVQEWRCLSQAIARIGKSRYTCPAIDLHVVQTIRTWNSN